MRGMCVCVCVCVCVSLKAGGKLPGTRGRDQKGGLGIGCANDLQSLKRSLMLS
jgi:hypothetical protein